MIIVPCIGLVLYIIMSHNSKTQQELLQITLRVNSYSLNGTHYAYKQPTACKY